MDTLSHYLFFFDSLTLGGAERYGLRLAYYLKNQGHKITVVAFKQNNTTDTQNFFFEGPLDYKIIPYGFTKDNHLYRIIELLKIIPKLKSLRPEIILSFTVRPNIISSAIWRFTGAKKHIWNQQDEGFGLSANRRDKILLRALKQTSFMVSNSVKGCEKLKQLVDITQHNKIKYIPNGIASVNLQNLKKNNWRSRLKISAESFVAVKLANLTSYKDHITLLKGWKLFSDKFPTKNSFLILAGRKGDTFNHINTLINELNLKSNVFILGQIDNVNELLIDCDIAIHSSKSEGLPNSVMECMNIGLPLIASKIDGHIEALTHKHPLYFTTGDEYDLCDKIALCYQKMIDLTTLGQWEQTLIKEKYGIDNFYAAFNKIVHT